MLSCKNCAVSSVTPDLICRVIFDLVVSGSNTSPRVDGPHGQPRSMRTEAYTATAKEVINVIP